MVGLLGEVMGKKQEWTKLKIQPHIVNLPILGTAVLTMKNAPRKKSSERAAPMMETLEIASCEISSSKEISQRTLASVHPHPSRFPTPKRNKTECMQEEGTKAGDASFTPKERTEGSLPSLPMSGMSLEEIDEEQEVESFLKKTPCQRDAEELEEKQKVEEGEEGGEAPRLNSASAIKFTSGRRVEGS